MSQCGATNARAEVISTMEGEPYHYGARGRRPPRQRETGRERGARCRRPARLPRPSGRARGRHWQNVAATCLKFAWKSAPPKHTDDTPAQSVSVWLTYDAQTPARAAVVHAS